MTAEKVRAAVQAYADRNCEGAMLRAVTALCDALDIGQSTLYDWMGKGTPSRGNKRAVAKLAEISQQMNLN